MPARAALAWNPQLVHAACLSMWPRYTYPGSRKKKKKKTQPPPLLFAINWQRPTEVSSQTFFVVARTSVSRRFEDESRLKTRSLDPQYLRIIRLTTDVEKQSTSNFVPQMRLSDFRCSIYLYVHVYICVQVFHKHRRIFSAMVIFNTTTKYLLLLLNLIDID